MRPGSLLLQFVRVHGQALEHGRGLEEGKPAVSGREHDHRDDFHRSDEFSRDDAGIHHVLVDQRQRAQSKADKVGLDEGPFNDAVQDLAGAVNDEPLGQDKGAGRTEDGSRHVEFPIAFRQKDEAHRFGKQKSNGSDND